MTHNRDANPYLAATPLIERDDPRVVEFTREAIGDARSERQRAVRLFYAVRDGIRYDPYTSDIAPDALKASATLERGRSFCIPKAILLAAAARSLGIPSRLGFADVRNHLASKRLLALLKTDVFVFHGYTELLLGGIWIKATPAFNRSLCEKFGVLPLDFDGRQDAILHPFDREGRRHMEYLNDRGTFADLPLGEMARAWRKNYPHLFSADGENLLRSAGGDLEAEAAGNGPRG